VSRNGRVRLAVVGCGAVVERCHAPALRRIKDVEVCALVDQNPRQLRRVGRRQPGARLCRDLGELPSDTDAALVAVPNALHAPVTVGLLRRGIHVLSEKPLATTVDAAAEMLRVASDARVVLLVGHHKRFVSSVQAAKQLLDAGRLGRLREISGSMGMPRAWQTRSGFHRDPALAGRGVLMDNGVHLIDLVLWLVGEMEVRACCTLPEGAVMEEEAKLEFATSAGAVGVLRLSHRRTLPNVLRIEGEAGFVQLDTFDYPSLKFFSQTAPLCRSSGSLLFECERADPYERQLEHFVHCVRGDEPIPVNSGRDGLRTLTVLAAAYRRAGSPR